MRDYLSQGHMELIQNKPINNRQPNYLPHHFVTKESSTTTKLRVVFDASRKTSNRKSLNDNLYVGPVVQEDLFDIITRWRIHKVAFTADIKQMYRQILVQKDDVDYQRILWRNNTDEPVADYRLLTVTYGTASAPYLATRTLQQLARDESDEFSKASNILSHDFYVDDVLSGDDSISEVLQLQTDLRILLRKGCFQLRKWISNKEGVLESLPSEERELNVPFDITRTITIKALGILWDPIKDIFVYKVNQIHYEPPVTKRSLLSAVSKIFDPLGWLSTVIISAKILLQSLWLYKLNWDDELPHHLELQWKQYRSKLPGIEELKIPRWISYTRSCKSFELHVFCDASLHAYGACVYARVVSETNSIQTSLMAAKTRVSPVKQLTLPRLELCAALLGTKLIKNVAQSLKIDSTQLYAWSDSKIVISWITGHSKQWKQFVSNRVTEIQETLHENKWGHVPSKENPADCSSRGLNPDELRSHHLWWSGPHWLSRERTYWPSYVPDEDFPPSVLEQEAKRCSCNVAIPSESSFMERSSSYSKLIRICAYIRRFITNAKLKTEERSIGPLTASEIHGAEKSLIRLAQKQDFNAEIIAINQGKQLKATSSILKLHPFLDDQGLLRVGGRLQHSPLSFNEKHPLILHAGNHFTKLLAQEIHKWTLHGGLQLMLNVLRKSYWIIRLRNLARRTIHDCTTCFRYIAKSRTQLMGSLPTPRVTPSRPFLHTGVDFAGPFEIKACTGKGRIRITKGYACLFVCIATRAIHLEAVSDLSTDAFLAAFRRFTSRRGLCQEMYSDCGTNFIGASRKISEEYHSAIRCLIPDLASTLALQNINWNFIPPSSPHFGGLWEAGVKSMKYHLRRVVKDTRLTFEEFCTVLSQIEACLNSRPLCPLTDNPNDSSVLTPGHFLVGEALLTPTANYPIDGATNYRSRWLFLQQITQDFWRRWSREYLFRLQQRPKWMKQKQNLNVGELVLVIEENLPPSRWALARILETHPGTDGLVRVVTLKSKNRTFKRPISKICSLTADRSDYSNNHNSIEIAAEQ